MSEAPRARYLALARRVRRAVVRKVQRDGPNYGLAAQARKILDAWEPEAAEQLRLGMGRTWKQAVRESAPVGELRTVFPQEEAARVSVEARRAVLADEFEQLDDEAKRLAFTVARVQSEEAVAAVRDAIARDVEEGGTFAQFRRRVGSELSAAGLGDSQAEALYRTHVGRAYSAGQIAVLEHPAVRSAFPYLQYSATHDSRTRPEHMALESLGLDGTAVYRADDPVWDLYYPPWAWNCRCLVIPTTVEQAADLGVREAREWLRSGRPPAEPEYVRPPGFDLPVGWVPTGRRLSLVG